MGGWVIVEVVRKGIVVGKCWSLCSIDLQMFSVSTVLGEKVLNRSTNVFCQYRPRREGLRRV